MFLSAVNIGLLVAVVAIGGREAAAAGWHYYEVSHWVDAYLNCGGQQQSPVDIKTSQVETGVFDPIQFHNYDLLPTTQTVTNDGHTIKVEINSISERPFIAWGGPWLNQEEKYNFAQYHFHWGSVSSQGSEHTINSVRYPMELHLVHFNDKYGDIGTALTKPDGLAVLGIFFEISRGDNPALAPLISALTDVIDYTATTPHYIAKDNLYALASLLPSDTKRFYRYDGSLTTPTCDESVLWTVFEKPIKISEDQLEVFRSVSGSDGQSSDNYRLTQPLNTRTVEKSWR